MASPAMVLQCPCNGTWITSPVVARQSRFAQKIENSTALRKGCLGSLALRHPNGQHVGVGRQPRGMQRYGVRPICATGSGGSSRSSGAVNLTEKQESLREQNKRLLAMQKELLDQIEERKKLHAAVLESLNDPAAKIKAFNGTETMGLPPVGRGAAPVLDPNVDAGVIPPPLTRRSFSELSTTAAEPETLTPTSPEIPPPSPTISQATPVTTAPPSRPRVNPAPSTALPTIPPATPRTPPKEKSLPPLQSSLSSSTPLLTPAVPSTFPRPSSPTAPTSPKPSPPEPAAPVPQKVRSVESLKWEKASVAEPPLPVKKQQQKVIEKVVTEVEQGPREKPPPLAGEHVMNVIVVAAECTPWSKTGGLGDVVGALPKALARRGHRTMVVVPRYDNYPEGWETGIRKMYNVNGQDCQVGYFHGFIDGVDVVFIDHSSFQAVKANIYGGSREEIQFRMTLFNKAAIEVPWHVPCGGICYGDSNLVFIANDWHTSLLPVYLQAYYRDHGLMQYARSILVIHNMAHQGRAPVIEFERLGLPESYLDKFKLYDPVGGEHMNIFMAGIITAHRLVAVSHGYAWECQTPEGGWGLHNVMKDHGWKLRGVVNGIDTQEWDPETDTFLGSDGYEHYSATTLEQGKPACKEALQRELGLPVRADVPLLGFIGRLDYQKGVDLIQDAMGWLMGQDVQLVMLGSGRDDLEGMLRSMEGQYKDKCRGWVGFSVKMAHRITAACDIILMPSRFEPCGLNQLYAMRYGTVPVVHGVGGLRDTVKPFDPNNDAGLGWTFDRAETAAFIHALGNALWTYREYKESWNKLQLRGMTQDLSWDNAAQQYEEVLIAAKYQW